MVAIMLDNQYANSFWCKQILNSLTDALRKKRIPFCEIYNEMPEMCETAFVIASDYTWTKSVISQFNANGIQPILICNQFEPIPGCTYSSVCSDINASMKELLEMLGASGNQSIALYGINTDSISDIGRVDSLFAWKNESINTMRVFENDTTLSDCFDKFAPYISDFDCVICVNDFAAVSLIKHISQIAPQAAERLNIISCTKSAISALYADKFSSLDLNFDQFGGCAVHIYEYLRKNPNASTMTVKVRWTLQREQTVKKHTFTLSTPESHDAFYKDRELFEMMQVDRFESLADETDRQIITSLLTEASYETIAEKCYLTVGGIKYRIKKILEYCGTESKEQLLSAIRKYAK